MPINARLVPESGYGDFPHLLRQEPADLFRHLLQGPFKLLPELGYSLPSSGFRQELADPFPYPIHEDLDQVRWNREARPFYFRCVTKVEAPTGHNDQGYKQNSLAMPDGTYGETQAIVELFSNTVGIEKRGDKVHRRQRRVASVQLGLLLR